jgi:hypothetical protein
MRQSAHAQTRILSQLSAAAPLLGVSQSQPSTAKPPARRGTEQDDWLDQAPDKHRVVFDTWLADRFSGAFGFALNWIKVNKEQYGLTDADLAVVIVARHGSTPFAFNEAMWTKYGKVFADHMSDRRQSRAPEPVGQPLCRTARRVCPGSACVLPSAT